MQKSECFCKLVNNKINCHWNKSVCCQTSGLQMITTWSWLQYISATLYIYAVSFGMISLSHLAFTNAKECQTHIWIYLTFQCSGNHKQKTVQYIAVTLKGSQNSKVILDMLFTLSSDLIAIFLMSKYRWRFTVFTVISNSHIAVFVVIISRCTTSTTGNR